MSRMPRGEPRTVPDPAGDLYDQEMAKIRAKRQAQDRGIRSPLEVAKHALHDFQEGPDIPRPTTLQSFIPVVGPAWQAAADFQDGDYAGAAMNGAFAVMDALPIGVAAKGLRAASKGIGILKKGSVTADASRKVLRRVGVAAPGQEIHHTVPLEGLSRNAQSWKNHYAFLKVLPTEQHRRLTGSWAGRPMYDPFRRAWYGTTDWMKAAPTGAAGYAADSVDNLAQPNSQAKPPR